MKPIIQNKNTRLLLWIIPVAALLITLFYVRDANPRMMNSDDASELVLGRHLADENRILSEDWYYSADIRVLNTNIIYRILFELTDNWMMVEMIGDVIIYGVLICLFYWMYLLCNKSIYIPLFAALTMLPISHQYFEYVLRLPNYMIYITFSLLSLIAGEIFIKITKKEKRIILAFIFLIFSFIVGLGGPRQVLILYLPWIAASSILYIIDRNDVNLKWIFFSLINFIGGCIGFFINSTVLSEKFVFQHWDVNFIFPSVSRLETILNGLFTCYGYNEGNAFSIAAIHNISCLLWIGLTIYAIIHALKNLHFISDMYKHIAAFTASALIIFILFYYLTTMWYQDRYILPVIVFSVPLLALFFENIKSDKISKFIAAGFLLCIMVCGFDYYQSNKDVDNNADKRDAVRYLVEEGYQNGYANYWDGNILTALSNGKIDIWILNHNSDDDFLNGVKNFDQTFHYLQLKKHDNNHPVGKVFILLTSYDFNENPQTPWRNEYWEKDLVYRNNSYCITGYDDYDTMKAHIFASYQPYEYDLSNNIWLYYGDDTENGRILYKEGCSYGPYLTLNSGEYGVIVNGDILNNAIFYSTSDYGAFFIPIDEILRTDKTLEYKIHLENFTNNFETLIKNETDNNVIINNITLYKVN